MYRAYTDTKRDTLLLCYFATLYIGVPYFMKKHPAILRKCNKSDILSAQIDIISENRCTFAASKVDNYASCSLVVGSL